jgi:hypothetical protein
MWARRNQVRVQNRPHDVLQPDALPHNLIAAGYLPAQPYVASLAIQTFGKKPLA